MQLIKGDENNLEGKVIAFSILDDADLAKKAGVKTLVFGLYATVNPLEYIERMKIPEPQAEEIRKSEMRLTDKGIHFPIYMAPMMFKSQEEVFASDEDVLYVGTFAQPSICVNIIKLGVEYYVMKFADKLLKNHPIMNTQPTCENYQKVAGSLREYMMTHFVTPMVRCHMEGQTKREQELRENIVVFLTGGPFETDIDVLLKAIQEQNPKIIDISLQKIDAIAHEDYLRAAQLRDALLKS